MPIRRFTSSKRTKSSDKQWRDLNRKVQRLKGKDLITWDLEFEVATPKKGRRR